MFKLETAQTSHNRPVYASPPVGGSGFRSPRSVSEQYQKKYPSGQHYIEIIIICQVNSVKKVQNLLILY